MGLDMYLSGKKNFWNEALAPKDENGYSIEEISVRLGYWRKHANLHGYIVQKFADGEDNCQDIELSLENLNDLLEVVKKPEEMPHTDGFFFGSSDNDADQIECDTEIFTRAIAFLSARVVAGKGNDLSTGEYVSVVYRASW